MEWFTESLRTLNLDNLIMKTTDAPTEGEQPMPPYRRRVRIGQNDDGTPPRKILSEDIP